MSTLGKLFGI